MLGLMRALLKIDYSNFKNMNEYVSEALTLAQKLADIGSPMDDKLIGVIILAELPSDYKPMVMVLESSGVEITSDLVKNKLLQEEIKGSLTRKDEGGSSEVAFAAKAFNKKKTFKKPFEKREIRCFGVVKWDIKNLTARRIRLFHRRVVLPEIIIQVGLG